MKPRIRLRFGIWSCSTWPDRPVMGCGYTPKAAYDDWLRQQYRGSPLPLS